MRIFKFILKEWKFRPFFPIIFVLTLSFGLMGPLSIELFRDFFSQMMSKRMESFLGGDLVIRSKRKLSDKEWNLIKSILPVNYEMRKMVSFYSMLKGEKLVQVKAVEFPFPLKGNLKLTGEYSASSIWMKDDLKTALNLKRICFNWFH